MIIKGEFDERQLVQQVLAGDKAAFVQLFRQYEGLVLHIVTPLVGITEDREDICQSVFLKVFEKIHTFRFGSKLGTWIGTIAYNTSINFLKKRNHVLVREIADENREADRVPASDVDSPEEMIVRQENLGRLAAAVDRLTPLQRTIVILFYQDDLAVDEIAVALRMPVNTVKSHLSRARQSLKQQLAGL